MCCSVKDVEAYGNYDANRDPVAPEGEQQQGVCSSVAKRIFGGAVVLYDVGALGAGTYCVLHNPPYLHSLMAIMIISLLVNTIAIISLCDKIPPFRRIGV